MHQQLRSRFSFLSIHFSSFSNCKRSCFSTSRTGPTDFIGTNICVFGYLVHLTDTSGWVSRATWTRKRVQRTDQANLRLRSDSHMTGLATNKRRLPGIQTYQSELSPWRMCQVLGKAGLMALCTTDHRIACIAVIF